MRKRHRNPFGIGVPDMPIGTFVVSGVLLLAITKIDLAKVAGEAAGKAGQVVGGALGSAGEGIGGLFSVGGAMWQYASVNYPTNLQRDSAFDISYTLNHRGQAGSFLTGVALRTVTETGSDAPVIWDINTLISVDADPDWAGYPVRLSRPMNLGIGFYSVQMYVRQNADIVAKNNTGLLVVTL